MPFDIDRVRELRPGNEFHYFPSVGSTMTEASRLIQLGARHGTVVLADEQIAGIGRLGRSWLSEKEAGIYASIVLKLPLTPVTLPIASLLIGLATAEAIQKSTQIACDLRWPNDVLIAESKVAGILPQLAGDFVIAGIGINVNNRSFPPDLRTPATSLLLASGNCLQSREAVLLQLLASLDSLSELLAKEGPQAILRAFSGSSTYVNQRRIVVEESGARGITEGLDECGFLLVRLDDGAVRRISSGGIRPDRGTSL